MEKTILWEKELKEQFRGLTQKQLEDFLDLVEFVNHEEIENCMCTTMQADEGLWDWLYEKDVVELIDLKRELSKYIQKTKTVEEDRYREQSGKVGTNGRLKILIYSFSRLNKYYISTVSDYYEGLRQYLAREKKDEFCRDLSECFPNIYFVEEIDTAVNTLNQKFEEIEGEIVEHLAALDGYHEKFAELMNSNKSFTEISQSFKSDTGIACSPQAGREHVQSLRQIFRNEETKQDEEITCELHTKFRTFNIDRKKQDRLYFFPGKKGIKGGKIIVKHIGEHL